MHSGPSGSSDLSALSKNEPEPEPPSALRPRFPAFVTTAPAKRITFFKSGDAKFSGVRMAIHHRSFKCFDALLDDLSQKVPLPFGVRTITTPRGTHSIKHLDQLQDGGCYLCSDRRYTKPINMELAGKRPAMWHHHSRPQSGRRKPTRPDDAPPEHGSPHLLRHPKRIVLVKNTDPSVRRSIILSRRTARSLRVFMEEVSELMQCHIKKLYTIEGRKIDSIQSLVHCPNVLVCVGREPFRPLMVECRKNSDEKLPGMGSRSRSSLCSDGHESKKNVNFGLETKKSIIHPRSDSSNRSTRFSLSSEKSYPNGVCTPGQSGYVANCTHGKEPFINDDIEKRVLVNKDGSLSVEMKVRFRLTNDETLQWSTEIKKSPQASNDALNDKEANPHYLQQAKESSEHESSGEVEEVYATKLKKRHIDDHRCENCCNHCQEYDIWKNPMHREHHRKARHVKSSSSSASSHKVVHKEASVDSIRTISRSSEEYTEHVVEKSSCYQQMMEGGDTVVEYCTISRCCSRSEVCSTATTSKKKPEGETAMIQNGETRPETSELKQLCCVEVTKASDTDDRPVSETSTSSKVLESLKEDQDDDFDNFPTTASRSSRHSPGECENEDPGRGKNNSHTPDGRLLSPKRRGPSACSVRSLKHKLKNESPCKGNQETPTSNERPGSSESISSSKSPCNHCEAVSTHSATSGKPVHTASEKTINTEEGERAHSTVSKSSRTSKKSHRCHKDRSPSPTTAALNGPAVVNGGKDEEEKKDRTISAMSGASGGSGGCSICPHCGACTQDRESASRQSGDPLGIDEENWAEDEKKAPSVVSVGSMKSSKSKKSVKSTKSSKCDHHVSSRGATPASNISNGGGETVHNDRVESALSNHSNASARSKKSNRSVCSNCRRLSATDSVVQEQESEAVDSGAVEEERVGSALSNKSAASHKSGCSTSSRAKTPMSNHATSSVPTTKNVEERDGATSAQSNHSQASRKSRKSDNSEVNQPGNQTEAASEKEEAPEERPASVLSSPKEPSKDDPGNDEVIDDKTTDNRASSALSNKTDPSVKSQKSNCSASKRAKSPATPKSNLTDGEEATEKRPNSASSAKSNVSAASGSGRSQIKTTERAKSPVEPETGQQEADIPTDERAASVLSNRSKASNRSNVSPKQSCSDDVSLPQEENNEDGTVGCTAEESEEPLEEKRAASAMSTASVRSRTSHRSACSTASRSKSPKTNGLNGEAERAKSPRPKSPARMNQEKGNKDAENRPSSALSVKSDVSRKSKQSKREASPANSCHNEISSAPEKRPSSATSRKSASEKAPPAQVKSPAPTNKVKEDEIEKRPLSALSVGTDVSRSSRKSKEANRSPSPAAKQTELHVASKERPVSAMSKRSTKSTRIQYKQEKDLDDNMQEKEAAISSGSSALQTSEMNGASELDATQAECTDTPAGQEVKQAAEEVTTRPKSALSVASQSPKKSIRAPSPKPRSNISKIGKPDEEQRPASAMSSTSKVSSKSKKCQCNHTPPKTPPTSSTLQLNSQPDNSEKASSKDAAATTMPDPAEDLAVANGSATVVTLDPEASSKQERAESVRSARSRSSTRSSRKTTVEVVKKEKDRSPSASSTSSVVVIRSKSPAPQKEDTLKESRPKSSASMFEKSVKSPTSKVPKSSSTPKLSNYLDIIVTQADTKSETGSIRSVRSSRKAKSVKFDNDPPKETTQAKTSTSQSVSQKCPSPPQEQSRCTPPTIRLASTSSDSVLSNARSAADLLRGRSDSTRPESRLSQRNMALDQKENDRLETKSNRSSKSAHKKISSSQRDEQSSLDLVQTCLPNASPADVVNEWLKNIPVDGPVYQMEEELNDTEGASPRDSVEQIEDSLQNDSELEDEQNSKTEENDTDPSEEKEDVAEETSETKDAASGGGEGDITDPCGDVATQAEECTLDSIASKSRQDSTTIDGLPKRAHSSVQVMKALLSPKLDRCNSLPEVSPAYGRRLSRSAEGLLDCLAKLRLIDSDPTNNQNAKYAEIMNILQTLWLYHPSEWDPMSNKVKDASAEDEANPRSSSGVDVSSGSDKTSKSMANNGAEKVDSAADKQPDSKGEETVEAKDAENAPEEGGDKEQVVKAENKEVISERINEADAENEIAEEKNQSAETPKETEDAAQSPNTSSGKESRSANDMESDRAEGSSSGTPPSVKQAQLAKRVSQEPDPTWVLSLLKKIEKQFMTHYANAMAEFKVRWDLHDNAMLDTMINELKVEVQKRIQNSIKRELQKIQGRAGKSPKPPSAMLSNESSVQTEQRRGRLKVMRNRSLKPSNSNGSDAASGTSFSDQRSDDEYCPCDACMRKKMEARQVIRAEVLNTAPVRMDFDLRKILQIKRDPPPAPKAEAPPRPPPPTQPESQPAQDNQQDGNLGVVEEEPEQEEEAPEETDAQAEEGEADEGADGPRDGAEEVDVEKTPAVEVEEEEEGKEAEKDNEITEDGVNEPTAVEEDAVKETGEDADEGETADVNDEGEEEEEEEEEGDARDDEAAENGVADGEAEGSGEARTDDDATDEQQSKDETEDNAIAEKTPMDDSTEPLDEIQEELEDAEDADDGQDDAAAEDDTGAEENEEAKDEGPAENGDEETAAADSKPPRVETWEQFRNRQMTRTSVESQPGSMDSMELQKEAKQIVQSVFSSIQGPKRDWDEADDGLSSSSKKRSRSPARANKPRRPKDSDVKVDDLEF